jgi:hypothetical protein
MSKNEPKYMKINSLQVRSGLRSGDYYQDCIRLCKLQYLDDEDQNHYDRCLYYCNVNFGK